MATTTIAKKNPLAAAFLAAQSELPEIGKDAEADAGSYSYKYASLPAILRECLPVFHKHGFALSQTFGGGMMTTRLIHEAGEMLSEIPCDPAGLKPQDFGSLVSYMRRYGFISIAGIAPDEDTDAAGVGESGPGSPSERDPADVAVDQLIKDDADMIRTWSPGIQSRDVTDRVTAFVKDVVRIDMDADEDIYAAAKRRMNSVIDQRASGGGE